MNGIEVAPTRAALLELREERIVVDEAYEFLDEKRLLLAAEILRQLVMYERVAAQVDTLGREAGRQLMAAVSRHGLQGTGVYPPLSLTDMHLKSTLSNFMGVSLSEAELKYNHSKVLAKDAACHPSTEASACQFGFLELTRESAVLAGISGNLHRLLQDYRATERRARALENVILPEIEQTLGIMTSHLEELDLEETVRAHLQKKSPQG